MVRVDPAALSAELLYRANRARARSGAPRLRTDPRLVRAARRYSRELARRRKIDHFSSTRGRRTFRDRIAAEGAYAQLAGENLARLTSSQGALAARVVELWLESPGHRRNLLDRTFRRTGIGVWRAQDGIWYVVQIYATRT